MGRREGSWEARRSLAVVAAPARDAARGGCGRVFLAGGTKRGAKRAFDALAVRIGKGRTFTERARAGIVEGHEHRQWTGVGGVENAFVGPRRHVFGGLAAKLQPVPIAWGMSNHRHGGGPTTAREKTRRFVDETARLRHCTKAQAVAMEKNPISPQGLIRLQHELLNLKSVERPAIIIQVATAREHGDLSENAEYHAAREKHSFIEGRIKELEDKVARAEVIDPSTVSGTHVAFGARVKLTNVDTEEVVSYRILGADETDLANGIIGIASPVARALLGKEAGDEVKIRTPGGERTFEITALAFDA